MLYEIEDLLVGQVEYRPSKNIKSPYVADVILQNSENKYDIIMDDGKKQNVLAHTASLGCGGLVDNGSSILLVKFPKKDKAESSKCDHKIYLSIYKETDKNKETIVGIHPKLAEDLVESALKQNYLKKLQNIVSYCREKTIRIGDKVNSRFDFTGVDADGKLFIMEVKNVPLAYYEDITAKERKKMDFSERDFDSKVAYFPDGYRKTVNETISPRALKHIEELAYIKKISEKTRCIMCYVIQRTDVNRFTASKIDKQYKDAFHKAIESGVEIITMVVKWSSTGKAEFVRDDLPIQM